MEYLVGAYAASPAFVEWNAALEAAFYDGLKSMPSVRGLEHPFYGTLHRDDDAWFLRHVDPRWNHVLTCIPGTMDRLKENRLFGLASTDTAGRSAAIEFCRAARDAVSRLNAHAGRQCVLAVQIHSAPARTEAASSSSALAQSLRDLAQWDWAGASLVIEHCDAHTSQHPPAKGFLSLDEELDAIAAAGQTGRIQIAVNWGRSAIEGRSVDTPLKHIQALRHRNALAGLMFSGVSDVESPYGPWLDTHVPPAPADAGDTELPAESLMTQARVADCIRAAGGVVYVGAKVMLRPKTLDVARALGMLRSTIRVLERATATSTLR